jgi:GNAT superfamily N-acetyltransferase
MAAHVVGTARVVPAATRPTVIVSPALPVDLSIRDARREDAELIFGWILELAEYERGRDQVSGSPQLVEDALFGPAPSAEALIAEVRSDADATWQPAGFALFYQTFSTWESRSGIWLEDLYVPPARRRSGVGGALLAHLANLAVARGHTRLEWAALDWNEPALNFYAKIGAARLDDWVLHRLDGAALDRVADGRGPVS